MTPLIPDRHSRRLGTRAASEWKASATIRKNSRSDPLEGPSVGPRRKNTKKWCRGIEGRPHDVSGWKVNRHEAWRLNRGRQGVPCDVSAERVCRECGKVIETSWSLPSLTAHRWPSQRERNEAIAWWRYRTPA